MRWISLALISALMLSFSSSFAYSEKANNLYYKLDLRDRGLEQEVFEQALDRFDSIKNRHSLRRDILSIADFTQSSASKRLYVIDLQNEKILFHTWVAHGKNSGGEFATSFSNIEGSKKTSLGYYLTAETYNGSNGYSMRLDGLDSGINNNARDRYIVMHGAWYVSQKQIDEFGRIGRSWGCPAVELSIHKELINTIKNGTVLYHHY